MYIPSALPSKLLSLSLQFEIITLQSLLLLPLISQLLVVATEFCLGFNLSVYWIIFISDLSISYTTRTDINFYVNVTNSLYIHH
jgi:hypothetical protein